ncbi:MAG: thioesterase [Ignavibacteriae bacterium]|nr:MAG: thioesterase [Ignavibacteriota bacterium]
MTEMQITYRGVVHPWHCDIMGHMNVVWYVSKFDEAAWQFAAMMGLDNSYFIKKHMGIAAVQQNITYKSEITAGSAVTVRSGVLEIKEKTVRIVHEMRNDSTGAVAAVMILTVVHFNTQKRKSCPLPADIRKRGNEFMVQYDGVER